MRAEERHVVGELRGELAESPLAVDVERVAGLDLDVRDPGAQRLCAPRRGQRAQLLRGRRARGGDGRADPGGRVRRARHPRGALVAALAGKDEVGVAVDEAGDDAAPARVDALVGGGVPGALDGHDAVAVEHERRVADGAELRVVRDEQPDVVEDEGAHGRAPRVGAGPPVATSSQPLRARPGRGRAGRSVAPVMPAPRAARGRRRSWRARRRGRSSALPP